jgi:hypothetical protein
MKEMSERSTEQVLVPRWALEFVLTNGSFQDEGPAPEGWQSIEMRKAMDALESVLKE